jgi:hypothetical protein
MKPRCAFWLFLAFLSIAPSLQAQQGYNPGDLVSTNFGFVNRYRWTNEAGRVFNPGQTFRLSDFDGQIVFFVFFDVW